MTTSYEIDEPLTEVQSVLLDNLLSRNTYRVRPVIDDQSSPADMLAAAAQLCRDAFTKTEADAVHPGDGSTTGRVSSVEDLRALEETISTAALTGSVVQAAAAVAMARYAAIDREVIDTDTGLAVPVERPLGHQADFADTDLAAACQMAPRTASTKLSAAVTACTKTPRLLEAAVAGDVPFWKVNLVAAELVDASADTAALVEAELLTTRGFGSWGYQKLKSAARALVMRWEADAAKQTRRRTMRDETGVWAETSDIPGMSQLRAVGPADQIARIYGALDHLADTWRKQPRGHQQAHPEQYAPPASEPGARAGAAFKPTLGQLRLDALHDLVTAGCTVDYQLVVHVPFERSDGRSARGSAGNDAAGNDAAGNDAAGNSGAENGCGTTGSDGPGDGSGSTGPPGAADPTNWAHVPGVGLVHPDTIADLVDTFGCRLTRVLIDADTGVVAETASAKYEPPPRIREFVHLRDQSCRFPGCSRPAVRCDEDHVQEWPTGDTKGANLAAMCRHHHDAKTKGHWDVEMTDDGVCTWISRTGRRYITYPDTDTSRTDTGRAEHDPRP